jgi:hypothetical protein
MLTQRGTDYFAPEPSCGGEFVQSGAVIRTRHRAVRTICRHPEGIVEGNRQIDGSASVLENVRDVEVPPDGVSVVDHDSNSAFGGEESFECAEDLAWVHDVMKDARTVDVIEGGGPFVLKLSRAS